MRIDPYKGKELYQQWKQHVAANGIVGLTAENAALITRFVEEMETGRNVSRGARKGPRGYLRLNTLRTRLTFVARVLAERHGVHLLTDVTEDEVHAVFSAMRNG